MYIQDKTSIYRDSKTEKLNRPGDPKPKLQDMQATEGRE